MSMDRSGITPNKQIIDEAAAWFVEINEGEPDRETRERFDDWLRRSPEHTRAYLRILPVWEEGAQLALQAAGNPQALIAWAREGSNVFPLEPVEADSKCVAQPLRRKRPWMLAASVVFLCVSLAASAWWLAERRFWYETGIGEQRLIALSDGSRIELNSRSRLRVRFDEGERGIELLAGQALFRVAQEASRPFVVRSGDVMVKALGTQFDVYRKTARTIVTVVEGRVAVTPGRAANGASHLSDAPALDQPVVVLFAGQQTVIAPQALPRAIAANVAAATAWTQQRLEFSTTSLMDVAEEFNRYNERQLVVREGSLRTFNVTGTFSSSDPDSLVKFLKAQEGIRVEESEQEIVISEK